MSIFSTGVLRTNSQEISSLLGFTIMQPSFSLTLLSLSLKSTLYPVINSFLFQNNDTMSALLSRIFCNFAVYVLFSCLKFLLWNFPIVNDFFIININSNLAFSSQVLYLVSGYTRCPPRTNQDSPISFLRPPTKWKLAIQ